MGFAPIYSMDTEFKPVIKLMLFVMITLWVFATCAGCTFKRNPAQQQNISNTHTIAATAEHPIPVKQLDADGDGTISVLEQRSLRPESDDVLFTFSTIVACVVGASATCAWLARGRRRGDPG